MQTLGPNVGIICILGSLEFRRVYRGHIQGYMRGLYRGMQGRV